MNSKKNKTELSCVWTNNCVHCIITKTQRYYAHEYLLLIKILNTHKTQRWNTQACLRRLVAGVSQLRSGFNSGPVHVTFVADAVALGQFFSQYFGFVPSITLHQCSILIFFYIILLTEGNRRALDIKLLSYFRLANS